MYHVKLLSSSGLGQGASRWAPYSSFMIITVIEAANGVQAWKILADLNNHVYLVLTEVAAMP